MAKLSKGILSGIMGQMSPGERKLLLIMGLLQNAEQPTKAEREIRAYIRNRPRNRFSDTERFADMEAADKLKVKKFLIQLSKKSNNEIIEAISKMNSLGLTKNDMILALNKLRSRQGLRKISEPAVNEPTNKPDPQKYAVLTCDSCDFTIDAQKDIEEETLACPRCGGEMVGITREDFHTKSEGDFNEATSLVDYNKTPKGKRLDGDDDAGM